MPGVVTYLSVLVAPRRAFARLREQPTWGWAAFAGSLLSLGAVNLGSAAQLQLLALYNQRQIAAAPPLHQAQMKAAIAQVAAFGKFFLLIGASVGPWILWFLVAVFFVIAAQVAGQRAKFGLAWVAAVNSYVVYALAALVNGALLASSDPRAVRSPLDLLRLPSPAMLVHGDTQTAAFLSAYNILDLWYFVVVGIALRGLLGLTRPAAIAAACAYSALVGLLAVATVRGGP